MKTKPEPKHRRPQSLRRLGAVGAVAAITAGLVAGAVGAAQAAELPPTGTFSDWAWTAAWANQDIMYKDVITAPGGQAEIDYDGQYVLTNHVIERAYPEGPLSAQPVNGWSEDSSLCWIEDPAAPSTTPASRLIEPWGDVRYIYPDNPQVLGELTPVSVIIPEWTPRVDPASPQSSVNVAVATFAPELIVDVAAACPSLNLAGPMYVQGADARTGIYQFTEDAGSQGNHLNWFDWEYDTGAIKNADVTAVPLPDGKVKFSFAKTAHFGEAMSGGVKVQALTTNGNQVEITVGYNMLGYGGSPTAGDIVRTANVGETVTITESELRASATYFSNAAPAILVTDLPADVVETEVNGERAFTYVATEEGAEARFTFAATEEQAPAGLVQSAPAEALILVLSVTAPGDPVTPTPDVVAEPPRFRADTGITWPATDQPAAQTDGTRAPGESVLLTSLIAVHILALIAGAVTYVFCKRRLLRKAGVSTE